MIALLASAPALPLGKAGKFVAAAYIVVFVVVLLYVTIMAVRAQRTARELERLRHEVQAARGQAPAPAGAQTRGETAAPSSPAGAPVDGTPDTPVGRTANGAGGTVSAADTERSGSRL